MKIYKLKDVESGEIISDGTSDVMLFYMADAVNNYLSHMTIPEGESKLRMDELEIAGDDDDDILCRVSVTIEPGESEELDEFMKFESDNGNITARIRYDEFPIVDIINFDKSGRYKFNYNGYEVCVDYDKCIPFD